MALADLYATEGDWHPDIDDLEIDEIDWNRFKAACEILGVEAPLQLRELVAEAAAQLDKSAPALTKTPSRRPRMR